MYNEDWECFYCKMSNNWLKDFCYWCKKPKTTEDESRISVYAPAPDSGADNYIYGKGYEMKQIHPVAGKNSTKYRWTICTPNFPSEQYKLKIRGYKKCI